MTSSPSSVPQPSPDDDEARVASGNKAMNILLLGLGGMVVGTLLLGIYKMAAVIIANQ
jgi:hypothetical protein